MRDKQKPSVSLFLHYPMPSCDVLGQYMEIMANLRRPPPNGVTHLHISLFYLYVELTWLILRLKLIDFEA